MLRRAVVHQPLPRRRATRHRGVDVGGRAGRHRHRQLHREFTPPAPAAVTSPASGSTLTSVQVRLWGTAEPGSTVTAYDTNAETYRTTTASPSGIWSITLDRDFFQAAGVLTGRRSSVTFGVDSTDSVGDRAEPMRVTYATRLR